MTHDYDTVSLQPRDIDSTHVLVGESGGLSAVYESYESNAMPGNWVLETEHGFLYLDPEWTYDVLKEQA